MYHTHKQHRSIQTHTHQTIIHNTGPYRSIPNTESYTIQVHTDPNSTQNYAQRRSIQIRAQHTIIRYTGPYRAMLSTELYTTQVHTEHRLLHTTDQCTTQTNAQHRPVHNTGLRRSILNTEVRPIYNRHIHSTGPSLTTPMLSKDSWRQSRFNKRDVFVLSRQSRFNNDAAKGFVERVRT